MINKKKIIIMSIGCVLLIFAFAALFVMKNRPQHAPQEGNYKPMNYVDGVAFSLNTDIANRATAISEISGNINIDTSQYYAYKDGGNNYLLFNMSGLVVACKKGTSFFFEDNKESVENNLKNSDIAGIWFEQNGNKITYNEQNGSYTVNVIGGLAITNSIYGDYIGQIKTITKDGTEWGLFVGVPYTQGTLYRKLDKGVIGGIETIVNSFGFSDYVPTYEEKTYEIVINEDSSGVNASAEEEETPLDTAEAEFEGGNAIDNGDEVIIAEETGGNESYDESGIDIVSEESGNAEENQSGDDVVIIVEDNEEEDSGEVEPAEEVEEPEIAPEPTEESEVGEEFAPEAEGAGFSDEPAPNNSDEIAENGARLINMTNQKPQVVKSADKAYTSDIYSMLDLKDNGIIIEYDYLTSQSCNVVINVERVYTGQSAIDLIKTYCDSDGVLLNYFNAPVGCTWHVAEYSLSYKHAPTSPYINIKLKGMDGEILKVNGISYSKRTYDISNLVTEDGDFTANHYVFYAVPNGWTEYCLECGTGNIDIPNEANRAAYYKIKNKRQE